MVTSRGTWCMSYYNYIGSFCKPMVRPETLPFSYNVYMCQHQHHDYDSAIKHYIFLVMTNLILPLGIVMSNPPFLGSAKPQPSIPEPTMSREGLRPSNSLIRRGVYRTWNGVQPLVRPEWRSGVHMYESRKPFHHSNHLMRVERVYTQFGVQHKLLCFSWCSEKRSGATKITLSTNPFQTT